MTWKFVTVSQMNDFGQRLLRDTLQLVPIIKQWMTMLSQQKIKDGSYVIEKERKRDEKINAGYEKIICMVYWLAKEEITMNKFPSLLDLLESVGCEDLSLFETLLSHIVPEIILILANNLRQSIVTQIKK